MQPKSIPSYSLQEFADRLTAFPDFLSSQPCVVTDFLDAWPASEKWKNFEYLQNLFGDTPVKAGAPQFTTHKDAKICEVQTNFADYLRYVQNPEQMGEIFKGKWIKGDEELFQALSLPLYCGSLRLVNTSNSALFSEITPILPEPMEHWNSEIPYYYQTGNHVWLYISLKGALTPLHQDNNAVIAYLAQLSGYKKAILYSPDDLKHYHNPSVGYMDPLNPNDEEFPTWRQAQPWTASLAPGQLLIWGSQWAHHVVTEQSSITVSVDVVNETNIDAYTLSTDWRVELGKFARANSDLIRKRLSDPQVLYSLENAPEEVLGRDVMLCVLRAAMQGPATEKAREVRERMLRTLEAENVTDARNVLSVQQRQLTA